MPIVSNNGVNIPFTADADDLVAESKRVVAELDKIKQTVKSNGKILEQQAEQEQEAVKNSTMSWTDFRSMYQTVLDVVKVGQAVWEETGGKFVAYADQVRDVSRSLGTTAEEASKLIQVSDDLGLSYDSLKTSLKLAQKDGFAPTIDGLAKMSDEYLKLQPGVERTQYLLDRFGKSGDEMAKMMEKGGDSIRNMSDAIDENMILTQENLDQARKYQVAVDDLKDSWDGLTYQAAPPLIEALTKLVNRYRDSATTLKEHGYWYTVTHPYSVQAAEDKREEADALVMAAEAAGNAGGAFESEAEKTKRLADEAKAAEQAIKDMTKANEDFLKLTEELGSSTEKYKEKMADLQEQHKDLAAKKRELLAQGYGPESDAIRDINEKLEENVEKRKKEADEFELAGRRRILSMLEQQLAVGGLTEAETTYLLDLGLKWGVYTETAVAQAKAAQEEVRKLTEEFNNLPTEHTFNIYTNYSSNSSSSGADAGLTNIGGGRAEGGAVSGGMMYPVNEKGAPELLNVGNKQYLMMPQGTSGNVSPMGGSSGGGTAGGIMVNILLDSATPDPERVAYELAPIVKRVLRQEGISA